MRLPHQRGLVLGLLSGGSFATGGVGGATLLRAGWSPGAVAVVRLGGAALVLTLPALFISRTRRRPITLTRRNILYGVVAIGGCLFCYANAIARMSVSLALLLEYSSVLLVVLWTWWHGTRPGLRTVGGGLLCLGGLVVALDLFGTVQVDGTGLLWAMGSAVGSATYFVLSSHEDDTPPIITAWIGAAIAAAAFGLASLLGVLPLHTSSTDVAVLNSNISWVFPVVGMALVSSVLAMTSGIVAARRMGPRLASFVGLSEVLFGVALAWILIGQSLTLLQCCGGLAVIAGIALVRSDESQLISDIPTLRDVQESQATHCRVVAAASGSQP